VGVSFIRESHKADRCLRLSRLRGQVDVDAKARDKDAQLPSSTAGVAAGAGSSERAGA